MAGRSRSKRGDSDPLGGLIEDLKRNPFPGMFSASSTTVNSVLLHDWWLVKCNDEGASKRLAVAGYIAKSEFPFMSAPIIKRHDTFTLEAADGIKVNVEGMINQTNTQNNGFSAEVCQLFNVGFPFFWEKYIDSCADIAPTMGTKTSRILEHYVTGARGSLNLNPKAIGTNMSYNEGPRSNTSEFEPGHEGHAISSDNIFEAEAVVNFEKEDIIIKGVSARARRGRPKKANKIQTDGKESSSKDTIPKSGNDMAAEELTVTDINKANKSQTDGKESSSKATMPESGNNTGAEELPVADVKKANKIQTDGKESSAKDTMPESGNNTQVEELPVSDVKESDKNQTDGKESTSKATMLESGKNTGAEELPVADVEKADKNQIDGKESSSMDNMPESENNSGAVKLPVADIQQHHEGSILTDTMEAEEFATPEKGDIVGFRKLPTAGKRENVVAESKVSHVGLRSGKGSSKKDHVPQCTTQATGRGLSRTNTEAHGATISPSPSESSIRRSRSGRAIIPTIDKGSQTVLYDEKGNFVGISTPISVSTGSESKRRSAKKRRF